jgi:prevent-host-death family protein
LREFIRWVDKKTTRHYYGHNNLPKDSITMSPLDRILPVTHVKKHLLDILKVMSEDHETITVTKNGKAVSVMMHPEHYDALMETIEILADSATVDALRKSDADFNNDRVFSDHDIWQA